MHSWECAQEGQLVALRVHIDVEICPKAEDAAATHAQIKDATEDASRLLIDNSLVLQPPWTHLSTVLRRPAQRTSFAIMIL
jgi:hypothetical protein